MENKDARKLLREIHRLQDFYPDHKTLRFLESIGFDIDVAGACITAKQEAALRRILHRAHQPEPEPEV